jgi:putative membrane protein
MVGLHRGPRHPTPMLLDLLLPYEFSATVLASCVLAGALYARGMVRMRRQGARVGIARSLSFYIGVVLVYAVMQTHIDYLSQHMFWVHRAQHLVLHHLGPFLVVLAVPHEVMAHGIPDHLRGRILTPLWRDPVISGTYRIIQHPLVASVLFVGLIYFWLMPEIHFDAMLSVERYNAMNWSMAIDGLLFWWLIVNPRSRSGEGLGYGIRILILWLIMLPQIGIGAYIALSDTILYDVYAVCGRAWPISPLVDQQIGGLITWIPASMMSVIGILIVLRLWMRDSRQIASVELMEPSTA